MTALASRPEELSDRQRGRAASERPFPLQRYPSPDASGSLRYASPLQASRQLPGDTVGALLADVAALIYAALDILNGSDQRGWGPDEHEQSRALQEALDEAKRDFQELGPLVNGQIYYEHDRNAASIEELRCICHQLFLLLQNFRNWVSYGGPINPIWAKETADLRRTLHRAQCRAARRISSVGQEASSRCLGAFLVRRKQRALRAAAPAYPPSRVSANRSEPDRYRTSADSPARDSLGASGSQVHIPLRSAASGSLDEDRAQLRSQRLDEIVACNTVGQFERFGDHDIAFVCDFCSGFIVWDDLETMPSTATLDDLDAAFEPDPNTVTEPDGVASLRRSSPSLPSHRHPYAPGVNHSIGGSTTAKARAAIRAAIPTWQATGFADTSHAEKRIVYAPIAIANHVAPATGDWRAGLLCPFCGDNASAAAGAVEGGASDVLDEDAAFAPAADDAGFQNFDELVEHLDWQHSTTSSLPVSLGLPLASGRGSCSVM